MRGDDNDKDGDGDGDDQLASGDVGRYEAVVFWLAVCRLPLVLSRGLVQWCGAAQRSSFRSFFEGRRTDFSS